MQCPQCGNYVADGATYCPSCGARQTAPSAPNAQPAGNTYGQNGANPYGNVNPYSQTNPYTTSYNNPYSNPYAGPDPNARGPEPAQGLAIASLVLGILSFFCFGIISGVLAIIFATMAKSSGNKSGMATAGMVCGVIGLVLTVLGLFVLF